MISIANTSARTRLAVVKSLVLRNIAEAIVPRPTRSKTSKSSATANTAFVNWTDRAAPEKRRCSIVSDSLEAGL